MVARPGITVCLLIGWLASGYHGYSNDYRTALLNELDVAEGGYYCNDFNARDWLKNFNSALRTQKNLLEEASWNHLTDMTDAHGEELTNAEVEYSQFVAHGQDESDRFLRFKTLFQNPDTVRQLQLIRDSTIPSPSNSQDLNELSATTSEMASIYAGGNVTEGDTVYHMEPELTEILATSRNYDMLTRMWTGFHDNVGKPMRPLYERYVELSNKAATEKGYLNMGEAWQKSCYEETDMECTADRLWGELKPLYEQLHAYVRGKLIENNNYAPHINKKGPIPAQLLGNMWAQEWQNIADLVMPYPEVEVHNVTERLIQHNYTVQDIFRMAEDYFTNIGLSPMTDIFWEKSMLTKPAHRKVECHGSAHDFYVTDDYRIKMCTEINQDYMQTVHHEMGHIEYFMQYSPISTTYRIKMCTQVNGDYAYIVQHEMGHIEYFMQYSHLPAIYREGANAAFHEAVGDTIALMVKTPEHLRKIGLLDEPHSGANDDQWERYQLELKRERKYLLQMALEKLPLLPFALVVEKWRYGVFRGEITPENYNTKWWELRRQYQGVDSPVLRADPDYFDPGAKYHIPGDVPYLRYFLSFVVQFQFHRALCHEAELRGDQKIHQCDIYDNEDRGRALRAGKLLQEMLSKGRSEPWRDVLRQMTGNDDFNSQALLSFFDPLHNWLIAENKKNGNEVGWD